MWFAGQSNNVLDHILCLLNLFMEIDAFIIDNKISVMANVGLTKPFIDCLRLRNVLITRFVTIIIELLCTQSSCNHMDNGIIAPVLDIAFETLFIHYLRPKFFTDVGTSVQNTAITKDYGGFASFLHFCLCHFVENIF